MQHMGILASFPSYQVFQPYKSDACHIQASKNEYAEFVNKEYQLFFEQMAKEQNRKDNIISMLLKFIKDNEAQLTIPQEIKSIMDAENDFEVL